MTILWFVVWLVAELIGDREPLVFDPVNWWTGTLTALFGPEVRAPRARAAYHHS